MGLFVALSALLLVGAVWFGLTWRSRRTDWLASSEWLSSEELPQNTPAQQLAKVAAHFDWPATAHQKDRLTGRIGSVQVTLLLPKDDPDERRSHWQLCFDSEGLSRFELLGLPPLEMKIAQEQRQQMIDRDVIWTLLNPQAQELLTRLSEQSRRLCFVGPLVLIDYRKQGQDATSWIQRIEWGIKLEQHLCDSLHLGKVPKGLLQNVQRDPRLHVQHRSLELLLQHHPDAEEAQWGIRTALARTIPGHDDHREMLRLILTAFADSFSEEWCPPEVSTAAIKSMDPSLQLLGALASRSQGAPILKQFALDEDLEVELRIRAIKGLAKRHEPKAAQPTLLALAGSENLDIRRQALQQLLTLRSLPRSQKWPSFEVLHQEALQLLQHVPIHTLLEITDWLRQYTLMDDDLYQHDPPLLDNTLYLLFRAATPEQIIRICEIFVNLEETAAEPLLLAWFQYEKVKWLNKDQEFRAKQAILDGLAVCGTIESIEPIRTCLANGLIPSPLRSTVEDTIAQIEERISAIVSGTYQNHQHGRNTPDPWYQSSSKQSMPGFEHHHGKL